VFEIPASLLAWLYSLVHNYAIAIALIAVVVMIIITPLTLKSTKGMLEMQRLAPDMRRLQQQYRNDRQKLNEEMMKLYQEHKVNPLGGCLPLVVQFPVFIALFHVLRSPLSSVPAGSSLFKALVAAKPGGLMFLGMDLSLRATDPHGGLLSALPYYILVGLVFLTGYLQSRQSQRNMPAGGNTQMQMVTKVLPIAFGAFSLFFPAGLVLYFLVSNLWRVGQQELIIRKIAPRDHATKGGAIDAKSSPAKREVTAPAEEESADEEVAETPAEPSKPAPRPRPAAPTGARPSPLSALRDLFRPPADVKADGPNSSKPAPAPPSKPAPAKQPGSNQPAARQGSARAGQSRRRRRRSSNKKRKR